MNAPPSDPITCKNCKRELPDTERRAFLGFTTDEESEPEFACLECLECHDDHEGIGGGQGRTGEEVAGRTDAILFTLAIIAAIMIVLAFIKAI